MKIAEKFLEIDTEFLRFSKHIFYSWASQGRSPCAKLGEVARFSFPETGEWIFPVAAEAVHPEVSFEYEKTDDYEERLFLIFDFLFQEEETGREDKMDVGIFRQLGNLSYN